MSNPITSTPMKRALLILLNIWITSLGVYGQQPYIDCENISKSKLYSTQQKYKDSAFYKMMLNPYTNKTTEIFSMMIDELTNDEIKALCIEAWYDLKQNGIDYFYDRFNRRFFKISRNEYLKDVQYLELLARMDKIMRESIEH
jgi:hypothetical protein